MNAKEEIVIAVLSDLLKKGKDVWSDIFAIRHKEKGYEKLVNKHAKEIIEILEGADFDESI